MTNGSPRSMARHRQECLGRNTDQLHRDRENQVLPLGLQVSCCIGEPGGEPWGSRTGNRAFGRPITV